MEFDRSWWTIRTKLDAYLDAAENQASAFGEAVEALDGYTTKCSLNLAEMNNVHVRTEHVDEAAYKQLLDTWYAVVEEVGVMASRMNDVDALYELARFDARAADAHLEPHRANICNSKTSSEQLVDDTVKMAMQGGFTDQIWKQLEAVFIEMPMLEDRFEAHGEEVPNGATWKDAAARALKALKDVSDKRDDLKAEVVARVCNAEARKEAPQPALLEVSKELVQEDSAGLKKDVETVTGMRTELRILTFVGVAAVGIVLLDKLMPVLRKKIGGGSAEDAS